MHVADAKGRCQRSFDRRDQNRIGRLVKTDTKATGPQINRFCVCGEQKNILQYPECLRWLTYSRIKPKRVSISVSQVQVYEAIVGKDSPKNDGR